MKPAIRATLVLAALLAVLAGSRFVGWSLAGGGSAATGARGEAALPRAPARPAEEDEAADLVAAPPPAEEPPPAGELRTDPAAALGEREELPPRPSPVVTAPRGALPPAPEEALGVIAGRLRSTSGTWADIDRLVAGHVHLGLVDLDDASFVAAAELWVEQDPGGETWIGFRFAAVPEGDYELVVSSLEHQRWTPDRVHVRAPAEGLEIWCEDVRDTIELAFRVLDATTREPVPDWRAWTIRTEASAETGVFFHAGALDLAGFPLDGRLTWSLAADGYAPAYGTEQDFLEEEDGRWVAEVLLREGWGTRFVVLGRDPVMRPLDGAEVLLDGRDVGRTGFDGSLDVSLDAEPTTLEVRWGDWTLRDAALPSAAQRAFRGQVTPLVLEPPAATPAGEDAGED